MSKETELLGALDTPMALLNAAVEDLALVAGDDRYVLDMSRWHEPVDADENDGKETCSVCVAGSVLAKSGGVGWREHVDVTDLSTSDSWKIQFLDALRDDLDDIEKLSRLLGWDDDPAINEIIQLRKLYWEEGDGMDSRLRSGDPGAWKEFRDEVFFELVKINSDKVLQ